MYGNIYSFIECSDNDQMVKKSVVQFRCVCLCARASVCKKKKKKNKAKFTLEQAMKAQMG